MAMIPSDALIVSLCADIYNPVALIDRTWDHFDLGADDGVCWGLKKLDGYDAVIFRGSITLQDWLRDLFVLPLPAMLPLSTRIGHVHAGFYLGMEHVWQELRPMVSQPVVIGGHSLGAARASDLCALMVVDGVTPAARVVFGEPKPGLIDLAEIIKDVPARSYRNGDKLHHDLVTDVPMTFPPHQFVHPTPIVPVCAEPTGDLFSRLGAFAYHHIQLYQAAVAALTLKEATS
jgi:hypothetical protein